MVPMSYTAMCWYGWCWILWRRCGRGRDVA